MEFGIKKCAMLIKKSGKRETMEGIQLPNQESIRMLGEKESYLEILEDERKSNKRVPQKNKKTFRT